VRACVCAAALLSDTPPPPRVCVCVCVRCGSPDPTGEQLQRLVPLLRTMVESCTKGLAEYGSFAEQKPRVWGIVWDFMSLPQRGYTSGYVPDEMGPDGKVSKSNDDRSPYQLARFGKGLGRVNVWYGAPKVTTLVLDTPMPAAAENPAPVDRRGWCIFERALSSITKQGDCCLELSRLPPPGDEDYGYWLDLTTPLMGARTAPLSPDAFERKLTEGMAREKEAPGTGFRFTNGCACVCGG
jgi:hypothetical protein